MFKKILVALDGSETADLALAEAINQGKTEGATIRALFVIDTFHLVPEIECYTVEDIANSIREEAQTVLAQAQEKMHAAGVNGETKILETNESCEKITEVIVKEADEWPADVIVIGTHGRRGFSHFLLGSVAEATIRIASKPVLLIRGKPSE